MVLKVKIMITDMIRIQTKALMEMTTYPALPAVAVMTRVPIRQSQHQMVAPMSFKIHHFVENDSETVDVCFQIVPLAQNDFRGHIKRRSGTITRPFKLGLIWNGQPKVN